MNRSIALFVALAVLIAHSFAIHNDGSGSLAPPYDSAYVAFRLSRNIVHEGALVWMPGVPGFDSYPSLLWVLVCAVGERLYVGINDYSQRLGMAAAVITLILTSRFHPDRIASLIAPLLLAISGGMAAAAVSGTETAALALFATAAFLSFEHNWKGLLGISLFLAGITRPEGWFLALMMFAIRLVQIARIPKEDRRRAGAPSLAPFAVPAAGLAFLALARLDATGHLVSDWSVRLARLDGMRLRHGLSYLRDFFVCTGSPLLLIYALWYLLRGRLSPTGGRALLLFGLWTALIVWEGGGGPIFGEALVPMLPIGLIAAQEGMITALNSTRAWVRGLAWGSFLLAVSGSALASRSPGDLGPLPFAEWQAEWSEMSTPSRYGYEDRLGRAGLREEISKTAYLRAVGIFLRDEVSPDHSVLTPWPGAIGYLSRLRVYDMLGRAIPPPGETRRLPWHGVHRIDVLAQLGRDAGYIAPFDELPPRIPTRQDLASSWLHDLDDQLDGPERRDALIAKLSEYELIAVPLEIGDGDLSESEQSSAFLLRRRNLGISPRLEIALEESGFTVRLRHAGHQQLADLWVRAHAEDGSTWYLDPTGTFREERALNARSYLLLYPTGERSIELLRARLPEGGPGVVELSAVLRNPDAQGFYPFSFASEEARIPLR